MGQRRRLEKRRGLSLRAGEQEDRRNEEESLIRSIVFFMGFCVKDGGFWRSEGKR
jgi:hypothetical protein